MTFRVGQKVVCVDASCAAGFHWLGCEPTEGRVYTVAGFAKSPYGYPALCLQELKHPWGYKFERFRPVVERKTSIAIFTQMLNPTQVDA